MAEIHEMATSAIAGSHQAAYELYSTGNLLGLLQNETNQWFRGMSDNDEIERLILQRDYYRAEKNYAEADNIRKQLEYVGIILEDGAKTTWRRL